ERFRAAITERVRQEHLDQDLHLDLGDGKLLDDAQIGAVNDHLHAISEETTPISLHVLGEPPPLEERISYLVTCLGSGFLERLAKVLPSPDPQGERGALPAEDAHHRASVRARAEEAVRLLVAGGLTAEGAVVAVGGRLED